MEKTIKITRSVAARMIEQVRSIVAEHTDTETSQVEGFLQIKRFLEGHAPPLTPCPGEAHKPEIGGMIDNCGLCAPRWGLKGPKVKIT